MATYSGHLDFIASARLLAMFFCSSSSLTNTHRPPASFGLVNRRDNVRVNDFKIEIVVLCDLDPSAPLAYGVHSPMESRQWVTSLIAKLIWGCGLGPGTIMLEWLRERRAPIVVGVIIKI
ncbi:hypothetical protein B0H67DRAFT_351983 [Lasiosphaeris hirsuta]|uniref:Uncharacterized protein n=1 Tax=Lasiosphaeris hirsuta TaxID=260670 RepID=A0AA39ZW08_9PEZI|nr:hypothetical protein B0H67DRAFT_351983 [Lasiosphaeris hirsuta]